MPDDTSLKIIVGIDVQADGRMAVSLWRGGEWNAKYAAADAQKVRERILPQALAEALDLAAVGQGPT